MLKAPVPVAMAATETKVGVIHPRLLLAHLSGCNMEASQEPIPSGLQKQELLSLSLGASHLSKWKWQLDVDQKASAGKRSSSVEDSGDERIPMTPLKSRRTSSTQSPVPATPPHGSSKAQAWQHQDRGPHCMWRERSEAWCWYGWFGDGI